VQQRTIALVWAGGLCLAALIYAIGPDRFLWSAFDTLDRLAAGLQDLIAHMGERAYDFLRAAAIALFAVFWALALIAERRGLKVRGAMFWVTVLFLVLVWRQGPGQTRHWLLAFVLCAAAAASITRRLGAGAPRHSRA
jgi:hypothetical protein